MLVARNAHNRIFIHTDCRIQRFFHQRNGIARRIALAFFQRFRNFFALKMIFHFSIISMIVKKNVSAAVYERNSVADVNSLHKINSAFPVTLNGKFCLRFKFPENLLFKIFIKLVDKNR